MANILAVGVATLDIISSIDSYPPEDSEQRAVAQVWQPGGNAANSLGVLRQLGHHCRWAGTLGDDDSSRWISDALKRRAIDISSCHVRPGAAAPVSCILRNTVNGSRTIVHYRDLDELQAAEFMALDLSDCDWIHFEGRNPDAVAAMLRHVRDHYPGLRCSIEIEKQRPHIEQLFGLADVLVFSRAWAVAQGFPDSAALLRDMSARLPGIDLYCAGGDQGAGAVTGDGRQLQSPAFPPARVKDTLAAGDVFNAAVIHGYVQGHAADRILGDACRLAGYKCGRIGIDGLGGVI